MKSPSKLLLSVELIRAVYEYSLGCLLSTSMKHLCPQGDGHPVMIIPGLGTSDQSTQYIRHFLNSIGYNTFSWGMGRNLGPRYGISALVENLSSRVLEISAVCDNRPVSIIGWSLGGIYAREISKEIPGRVRQVITLGTPFKNLAGGTNASLLYEILSRDKSHKDPEIFKKISVPPIVPFTSIYSKTDGVVSWQCSIEDSLPHCENIEIPFASHLGLAHNPLTMIAVAGKLHSIKERSEIS